MASLLIIVVLFALAWFLLVRPQRRRQQESALLLGSLEVGDEIVTAGGIYGRITALEENQVWVEIAPSLTVKVARRAIAARVDDEGDEEGEADEPPEPVEQSEPASSDHG